MVFEKTVKCMCEKRSSHDVLAFDETWWCEPVGISLVDIKNLGDWKGVSVLFYLTLTLESKVSLERSMVRDIFMNPDAYIQG